jgi:hypothetical protein
MVLACDVRSPSGVLLVARGYEVTSGLLERLRNFPPGFVQEPILVRVPPQYNSAPRPPRGAGMIRRRSERQEQ